MSGSAPLRICHLTAPANFGGLESVVAGLAAGLAAKGHSITIISLRDPAGPPPPFRESAGVTVVEIMARPRRYLEQVRAVRDWLRSHGGDVLHTHGYQPDVVGWLAGRAVSMPVVSTAHGFVGGGLKNRVLEWVGRRVMGNFAAVVAVSGALVEDLAVGGVDRRRIRLIHNGLPRDHQLLTRAEARARLGIEPGAMVAGWVGRVAHEKGPDVFLAALEGAPNWHASIIGDGRMRADLEARLAVEPLGARVTWHGPLENAAALLRAFDAIVLSSRTEGTPIVLLEAIRAAVPVVAAAVGGVPEVVGTDEVILVPPEAPAAIAAALLDIAAHPDAAMARVAAAERRLLESLSADRWLDEHEALYLDVAESGDRC